MMIFWSKLSILKNFSQLVMGFGIMFRVDEESAERHKGERKVGEIFYTIFSSEYSLILKEKKPILHSEIFIEQLE